MSNSIDIRIRDAGYQGYVASGGGKRASCTYGADQALTHLTEKLFPGQDLLDIQELPAEAGDEKKGIIRRVRVTDVMPAYAQGADA